MKGKLGEVDNVLGCCDQVHQLPHLGLVTRVMENLDEVHVIRLPAEIGLEKVVYRALQHERIVDRDQADAWGAVPTRLPPTSYRAIHHVVADEEKCLQLRNDIENARLSRKDCQTNAPVRHTDTPSQNRSPLVLNIVEWSSEQDFDRVRHRDPAIELPSRDVVIQILYEK